MFALWISLLVLHQGYSLVPVITVQFGEPATLTCVLPNKELSSRTLQWYKQRAGETLQIVVTLWKTTAPEYGPEFTESRLAVNYDKTFSNLTILRTVPEDEGMYHCAIMEWVHIEWSGTYLSVKGNSQRTSNYSVVQSTVSDPVRPGDSVTLQCSVLSDSESDTCPRNHSVYWFRAGSDESHPNIIYTNGNNECEKRSDTVKSCVYHFSVDISSSDAGTYYCAVATCGQILFGNGTKLDIDGTSLWSQSASVTVFLQGGIAVLSIIVIAFFIYAIKKNKCDSDNAAVDRQTTSGGLKCQQRYEDAWDYSAVIFTVMKTDNGAKKAAKSAEREKIYAAVKAFRLD
ncbi:signal-regulatory protein beta-2-like isoform X2 [Mastacembelus armatus]|uniref:Uncharacterized LOC113144724 n=1 Tax=Mastacembelus armatus TaxID=205130 RepID=A0A7N8YQ58_9TELE|nr:signal-regulatory protein beta-2-like isoform X2 [Mastacembelus armatus]